MVGLGDSLPGKNASFPCIVLKLLPMVAPCNGETPQAAQECCGFSHSLSLTHSETEDIKSQLQNTVTGSQNLYSQPSFPKLLCPLQKSTFG